MNVLGPGNLGGVNLASSFAGAQRTDSHADQNKAEAAAQKFQGDQKEMSARSLGDVTEADLSADRDADGSLLETPQESSGEEDAQQSSEESPPESQPTPRRAPDLSGNCGNMLDVDA